MKRIAGVFVAVLAVLVAFAAVVVLATMIAVPVHVWHDVFPKRSNSHETCAWSSHPNRLYRENWLWVCDGSVRGTVRGDYDDDTWQAFHGQSYCGAGVFTTIEAAKACVEGEGMAAK